jgi:hypothetical protein
MKKHRWYFILAFLPVLCLAGIPNYAYYWDGVSFSCQIENEPLKMLYHPHHLIFSGFFKLLYILINGTGAKIRALDLMIYFNILTGIIYLIISYLTISRISKKTQAQLILVMLTIAFSFTFASHFRNVSTYIISITLLAIIIYRITKSRELRTGIIDWLLLLIAILFHQVSFLCLPALTYAAYVSSARNKLRNALTYSFGFLLSALVVYFLIFYLSHPYVPENYPKWFFTYGSLHFWVFSHGEQVREAVLNSLNQGLAGHMNLFLAHIDRSILQTYEYKYISANFTTGRIIFWTIFIVIFLAIIRGFAAMFSKDITRIRAWFLIIWIIPYFLFFLIFMPYMSFYKLFYLLPLMIAFTAGFSSGKVSILIQSLVLTCLIGYNLLFGLIPDSNPENNPYLSGTKEMDKITHKGDLVMCFRDLDYFSTVYLEYFSDRDVFTIKQFTPSQRPNISFEQYETLFNDSQEWITGKFDRIYMSMYLQEAPKGYMRVLPSMNQQDAPPLLLINRMQIYPVDDYEINEFVRFYRIELKQY